MNSNIASKRLIFERLTNSISQCLNRFGNKTELATDSDGCIIALLSAWETVLEHDLLSRPRSTANKADTSASALFRQVGELTESVTKRGMEALATALPDSVANRLQMGGSSNGPSFWACVREVLSQYEVARYSQLKGLHTDAGRARSWLRAALNERTLQRTLVKLTLNPALLSKYYGENAIVLDREFSTQLPVLAGKLTTIFFALTIDKPSLDTTSTIATLVGGDPSSVVPRPNATSSSSIRPTNPNPNPIPSSSAITVPLPPGQASQRPSAVAASVPVTATLIPNGSVASPSVPVPVLVPSNSSAKQQQSSERGVSTYSVSLASSACSNSFLLSGSPSAQPLQPLRPPRVQHLVSFGDGDQDASGDADALERSSSTADSGLGPAHKSPAADPSSLSSSNKSNSDTTAISDHDERSDARTDDTIRKLNHGSCSVPYRMSSQERCGGGVDSGGEADRPEFPHPVAPLKARLISDESSQQLSASAPRLSDAVGPLSPSAPSNSNGTASARDSPSTSAYLTPHSTSALYASPAQSSHGSQEGLAGDGEAAEAEQQAALASAGGASLSPLAPGAFSGSVIPLGPCAASLSSAAAAAALEGGAVDELDEDAADVLNESRPEHVVPEAPEPHAQNPSMSASTGTQVEAAAAGEKELVASATVGLAPVRMRDNERSESGSARSSATSTGSGSGSGSGAASTPLAAAEPALTNKELKQALVNLVQKKDALELRIQTLLHDISTKSDVILTLEAQLEEQKNEHRTALNKELDAGANLKRENELLRQQLKKYVETVQVMRRSDGAGGEQLQEGAAEARNRSSELAPVRDYSLEVELYEQKLVQAAEMHGELIEFNDFLQKQLRTKDAVIEHFKQQLVHIRGPLPQEEQAEMERWLHAGEAGGARQQPAPGTHSRHPSTNSTSSIASSSIAPPLLAPPGSSSNYRRPLLSIWIPSVYLINSPHDAHHVYQIFARIADFEWNVFRRYTEFHTFHQKYRKLHPVINTYGFPPKKTIGRRETKFVEERRRKLQDYLRRVVNFMLAKYPEFAQNTTPASTMSRIPLLAESSLAESGASSINAGASSSANAAGASVAAAGPGTASSISGRERTRGDRGRAIMNSSSASALRGSARTSMGTINESAGSGSTSRTSHQRPSLPSNVVPNRKKMSNQPSYSGL